MIKNQSDFQLDQPYHTFIISEAGSNWKCGSYEDDLNQAKKMIKVAAKSGTDAVKFQTFRSETLYAPDAGKVNYFQEMDIKSVNDLIEFLTMPDEMIPELAEYCNQQGVLFMSTPFSVEDAKRINPCVSIHIVASFEINHVKLLENLAQTKKPILISTGASTIKEIDFAVSLVKDKGNPPIALMQCTSSYPAPLESLNLKVIPEIKSRYKVPVGFSDHSVDPIIGPLLAVGLGATILEKHFTLDKSLKGPDHPFSLNPKELTDMIAAIRKADKAKGTGQKEILKEEIELRRFGKRAIQAIKNISKGEILKEGYNFEILRPGNHLPGLEPIFINKLEGKKSAKDVPIGEGIKDYE